MALAVDVWVPDLKELATHPAYLPGDGLDLTNRPNVIDVWSGSGPGRSLLLNGHMDIIPVEPAAAWTHAPLSGHEGHGQVYGRGASDMKGGLAAMTMAVKTLQELKLRPQGERDSGVRRGGRADRVWNARSRSARIPRRCGHFVGDERPLHLTCLHRPAVVYGHPRGARRGDRSPLGGGKRH
jgi:hypothetical protein